MSARRSRASRSLEFVLTKSRNPRHRAKTLDPGYNPRGGLSRRPGIIRGRSCRLRWRRGRHGRRLGRGGWCCCCRCRHGCLRRLLCCHWQRLFLLLRGHGLFQLDVNRVGRQPWGIRSGDCLRANRDGLRLVVLERECAGKLGACLQRQLAGRVAALPERSFHLCSGRLGLEPHGLGWRRRRPAEIQTGHGCGAGGERKATRHNGKDSAHVETHSLRRQ